MLQLEGSFATATDTALAIGGWRWVDPKNICYLSFGLYIFYYGEELEIELPVPPRTRTASRSRQQLIFGLCIGPTVVARNSINCCWWCFFSKKVRPHQIIYYKYYGLWGGYLYSRSQALRSVRVRRKVNSKKEYTAYAIAQLFIYWPNSVACEYKKLLCFKNALQPLLNINVWFPRQLYVFLVVITHARPPPPSK